MLLLQGMLGMLGPIPSSSGKAKVTHPRLCCLYRLCCWRVPILIAALLRRAILAAPSERTNFARLHGWYAAGMLASLQRHDVTRTGMGNAERAKAKLSPAVASMASMASKAKAKHARACLAHPGHFVA